MSAEAVDVVRQADVVRQLKIKTGSLKRVHKELSYYEKDREKEQAKLEKLKADGAPEHDIKQAVGEPRHRGHVRGRCAVGIAGGQHAGTHVSRGSRCDHVLSSCCAVVLLCRTTCTRSLP